MMIWDESYDLVVQAAMIAVTIFMFLFMQNIPQKYFSKIRLRGRANLEAKRRFIKGAQLFSQAKSAKDRAAALTLAKAAIEEADAAIAMDRKDAAAHILKALALDLRGLKPAAIESLDAALAPRTARSLSEEERGDALFKRAELKAELSRRGKVESAVEDLVESVRIKGDNVKAFCLLGDCYEKMGLVDEAKKAYADGLNVEPTYKVAREALDRLGSA